MTQILAEDYGILEGDLFGILLNNEPIYESLARFLRLSPELHQLSQTSKKINQIVNSRRFLEKAISSLSQKQINWVYTWYKKRLRLTILNCRVLELLLCKKAVEVQARKKRRTSGFQIFSQSYHLSGRPGVVLSQLGQLSAHWKTLTQVEKESYHREAEIYNNDLQSLEVFEYPY